MGRPRRADQVMQELNSTLQTFELPIVEGLHEINSNLLIALYESLKGSRLKRCGGRGLSKRTRISDMQLLLTSISQDIKDLNVEHFDAALLCAHDSRQLLGFIELLLALSRVFSISRSLADKQADDTSESILTSMSMTSGEQRYSMQDSQDTSSIDQDKSQAPVILEDSSNSLSSSCRSDSTLTKIMPNAGSRQIIGGKRQPCASKQPGSPAQGRRARLRRHIRQQSRRRCLRHLDIPSNTSMTPLVHQAATRCTNDTRPRPSGNAEVTVSREHMDEIPSFFSQTSACKVKGKVMVDSPYTKYLRARRDMVLAGIDHKLSPLRSKYPAIKRQALLTPPKSVSRRRRRLNQTPERKQLRNMYSISPLRAQTFPQRLAPSRLRLYTTSSLVSSTLSTSNSDESFYDDQL